MFGFDCKGVHLFPVEFSSGPAHSEVLFSCSVWVLYHIPYVSCNPGGLDSSDDVFKVWKGKVLCRSHVAEEVTAIRCRYGCSDCGYDLVERDVARTFNKDLQTLFVGFIGQFSVDDEFLDLGTVSCIVNCTCTHSI